MEFSFKYDSKFGLCGVKSVIARSKLSFRTVVTLRNPDGTVRPTSYDDVAPSSN